MTHYDNSNKGALWNKTAFGRKSISGILNVEGTDYNISVFNNDKQGNEARPDFNIVINPQEDNTKVKPLEEKSEDLSIEDLPF